MVTSRQARYRLTAAACLMMALFAASARAGASIVEPRTAQQPSQGYELAVWGAMSVPSEAAGDVYDRGFELGMSVTEMISRRTGVGLDIGYSRWPSERAGAALDGLFSMLSGGAPISGSKVSLTGIQAGIHVRLVAAPDQFSAPWIQIGAGLFGMKHRIELPVSQLNAAGIQVREVGADSFDYGPVFATGVGLDFPRIHLGLGATYEWIRDPHTSKMFTSLTIGMRAVLGN